MYPGFGLKFDEIPENPDIIIHRQQTYNLFRTHPPIRFIYLHMKRHVVDEEQTTKSVVRDTDDYVARHDVWWSHGPDDSRREW